MKPTLVTIVKIDPNKPNIYDLRVRLCANGALQELSLETLYSPVYLANSLHITIVLAAAFNLSLLLIDVVNTYQNTILMLEQMSYIYSLPFYIEWFHRRFPKVLLP